MKSLRFIREVTALALVLSLFAGVLLIGTSQANALPGTDTSPLVLATWRTRHQSL